MNICHPSTIILPTVAILGIILGSFILICIEYLSTRTIYRLIKGTGSFFGDEPLFWFISILGILAPLGIIGTILQANGY